MLTGLFSELSWNSFHVSDALACARIASVDERLPARLAMASSAAMTDTTTAAFRPAASSRSAATSACSTCSRTSRVSKVRQGYSFGACPRTVLPDVRNPPAAARLLSEESLSSYLLEHRKGASEAKRTRPSQISS